MRQDEVNSVINEPAVKQQLNMLFDQLQKVIDKIKQINQANNQINLAAGLNEATRAAQEARAATEELRRERAELQRQEAATRAAAAQAAAQAQANAAAQQAATQSAIDAERIRREAARAALEQARLAAQQARQQRNNTQNAIGSLNDLRARLRAATAAFDAMGEAERNAFGAQRIAEIQELQRQIRALEGATGRNQRNVGNYAQSFVGGLTKFAGQLGLAYGGAEIVKSVFETTVALDSQNAALKNISKTQGEFLRNQQYLADISERLGLKISDVTGAYKSFYAAATQAGLSATETRRIFSAATEAASTLRLSSEDVNGVLLAFGQILGKGKVQAEELRGQIGERIPGAFAIAARSIGVTQAELSKMLEQGQLIASDFLPKFATELQNTFGNGGAKVEGLQASVNRLSNAFTNLVSDNGSGLSTFFKLIIDFSTEALNSFNNLIGGLDYVILKFTDAKKAAEFLNSRAVNDYSQGLKSLNTQDLLNDLSNVNKNLSAANNRVKGLQLDIRLAGKIGGATADSMADQTKELEQQQIEVDRLTKLQIAYQKEIDKRLKPGEDLNASPSATASGPTEKELNAQAALQKRYLQALFEQDKFELESNIAKQKAIAENEKKSYDERIDALQLFYLYSDQLAQRESEYQKDRIRVELGRNKASAVELKTADSKLAREREKIAMDYEKTLVDILGDNADARVKKIMDGYAKEKEAISQAQNEELARTQGYYDTGAINKEQYEAEKLRITNKYAILELQAQLTAQQAVLDLQKARGADVSERENKILEIRNAIRALDLKYHDDTEKAKTEKEKAEAAKREQLRKQEIAAIKTLAGESIKAFTSIFTAQYENQKNAVQDQIDDLDKVTQKEIDAVEKSTASEQEKADKVAVINARSQAQKEQLERRQRQIDQARARFERLQSIAQIIASTAVNIVKVFPNPVLIALAAATGAAQLAQVLATPIPRYAGGTEHHKGGAMMVNDGGQIEPIESPSGKLYVAYKRNAIVYGEKGTKVYKSFDHYFSRKGGQKHIPAYNEMGGMAGTGALAAAYEAGTNRMVAAFQNNGSKITVINTMTGLISNEHRAGRFNKFVGTEIQFGKR